VDSNRPGIRLATSLRVEPPVSRPNPLPVSYQCHATAMTHQTDPNLTPRSRLSIVLVGLLGLCLLWADWPTFETMARRWMSDPRYSHGYLVPAFALFLLWTRRDLLAAAPSRPSWWGIPLLAAGVALKCAGIYYYVEYFEFLSLLPSLAGLALVGGGWAALRWSAPSIGFLFFMMPLPYRVELALGAPLQRIATLASTFALQTLGLPAVAEGNIILMNDARIGVVEACNGLGMLFMFLAFAAGAALVIRRPLTDKLVILLSAAPIALVANVARITVTGLLHETAGGKVADVVYHDLAGWLMMPLALAALWAEIQLLSRLFIEIPPARDHPLPIDL
jgi:exosortase